MFLFLTTVIATNTKYLTGDAELEKDDFEVE